MSGIRHRRFVAEWEEECAILVALPAPHTDWNYILEEAQEQYRRLITALADAGERVMAICPDADALRRLGLEGRATPLVVPYNDTWTRDYGPLSVRSDREWRLLDFGFNGWGLKFAADRDNLAVSRLERLGIWTAGTYRRHLDYVLEGGSVDTDGRGTMLTTSRCLCSPNRNGGLNKREVTERLTRLLGVDHILWLDHGALEGDDTDSHIDTLARMAPDDTIIYTGCQDPADSHYDELQRMLAQLKAFRTIRGERFNLVELPLPAPLYDEDGSRLPATYANYLVGRRNLFVPLYGQPERDRLAMLTLQSVFTGHRVTGVDCRTLLRQHGSLHCATMQIPLQLISK